MYLTGMSCASCTARMIQTGITRVVIPCCEEDAFWYRDHWQESFDRAEVQMISANVELKILDFTGFDCRELMGPLHPYWKGERHPYFDRFDGRM